MSEHDEPAAIQRHKIDITVAGHTVIVDSDGELQAIAEVAMRLFDWSSGYAKQSAVGFAVPAPMIERAPEEGVE